MISEGVIEKLVAGFPETVSALACLFMFFSYSFIPKKTLGLKMIFVLSLSDFIFHVGAIIELVSSKSIKVFPAIITNIFFRFSLFWASNMAFFLYKLMTHKSLWNQGLYFKRSLALVLTCAVILSSL